MAATVHIVCGPASAGKTLALLRRCRSAAGGAAETVLWLAPTLHRAEEVRVLLCTAEAEEPAGVGQRRRGCISPLVSTFQDFADEVVAANDPGTRPLSRVQRRLLVDEVVADLHGRGGLAHFARVLDTRGFTEGTLALLEELKSQEIRPGQFARAAHRRSQAGPGAALHASRSPLRALWAALRSPALARPRRPTVAPPRSAGAGAGPAVRVGPGGIRR